MVTHLLLCATLFLSAAAPQGPKAPELLPWQNVETPEILPSGKIVLSPSAANEVLAHLKYAEKLPQLCQKTLDAQEADCQKRLEEAEAGMPLWTLPVGIISGLILGSATIVLTLRGKF